MQTIKAKKIIILHYMRLIFRSVLFLAALCVYLMQRACGAGTAFGGFAEESVLLRAIWCVFFFEMLFRFLPSNLESMGCQKQFKKPFVARKDASLPPRTWRTTAMVAAAWIFLNIAIGALYLFGVTDEGFLLLVALFYSVCDCICILFFCPFQTWFMKNKCCVTCRIYNWDYAMMFTPLLFVKNIYGLSLLAMALLLLLKWEITAKIHPERFFEETNATLSCANCTEKLCRHKKQLRRFLQNGNFNLKGNSLFSKE